MPWTRRSLLFAGAAMTAGAVTGCTFADPRIEGSAAPTGDAAPPTTSPSAPKPTPTPTVAGTAEAARVELDLAGKATALTSRRLRRELEAQDGRMLQALRAAHLTHAAALLDPAPTARAVDQTPRPKSVSAPSSLSRGLRRLADAEEAAAGRYRRSALAASGFTALLFGSLSVAATTYAAALVADSPGGFAPARPPQPMPRLSDSEAMAELVRQLHAVVYGYQLAIGQLKVGGSARDRAVAGLLAHRVLRDKLTSALIERSVEVPVAEPAYVPSVRPRSPATAAELIKTMEVALAPFCGLWLASAAAPQARRLALDTLTRTVKNGRSWGAPMSVWPGWTT